MKAIRNSKNATKTSKRKCTGACCKVLNVQKYFRKKTGKDANYGDGYDRECKGCVYIKAKVRREKTKNNSCVGDSIKANHLFNGAKRRAKLAGVAFDSKIKDHIEDALDIGFCEVTDQAFVYNREDMHAMTPSLDRKIPKKGYVCGNIQVVTLGYNRLKGPGTHEDAVLVARATVKTADRENKFKRGRIH